MLNVGDLRLEQDLLPFFDYTDNPYARHCLLTLLQTPPPTEAGVTERQLILRGFMTNSTVLEQFAYRKLDYLEVYAYFQGLGSEPPLAGVSALRERIYLRFSEARRSQQRAPLIQLILFLEKLNRYYLLPLEHAAFPADFQSQLVAAGHFLAKLNLPQHLTYVLENTFSSARLQNFAARLRSLPPQERTEFWAFLTLFEAYWSIARGMMKHGFSFPRLGAASFRLHEFYHPVVVKAIKNSLTLAAHESVVVLTGPNMSGKSTLLRAVGVCVYLAHVGVGVPAAICEIPFFATIAVNINLNDNLLAGYSHFMTEVQHLKAVVERASAGPCFAVFDELFRGTNVDDALDITQTTLRGLTQFGGSFFFISTHLVQLEEELANVASSVKKYYIECQLQEGVPRFSYRLCQGWSTLKIGRILFEKEGLGELLQLPSTPFGGG